MALGSAASPTNGSVFVDHPIEKHATTSFDCCNGEQERLFRPRADEACETTATHAHTHIYPCLEPTARGLPCQALRMKTPHTTTTFTVYLRGGEGRPQRLLGLLVAGVDEGFSVVEHHRPNAEGFLLHLEARAAPLRVAQESSVQTAARVMKQALGWPIDRERRQKLLQRGSTDRTFW